MAIINRDCIGLDQRLAFAQIFYRCVADLKAPGHRAFIVAIAVFADHSREGAKIARVAINNRDGVGVGSIRIAECNDTVNRMRGRAFHSTFNNLGNVAVEISKRNAVNRKPAGDTDIREPAIAVAANFRCNDIRRRRKCLGPDDIAIHVDKVHVNRKFA